MNILILSNGSWDDQTSIGNTLSNLFSNWSDVNYAFIYNRLAEPNNNCCNRYYSVPITDIVYNFFAPAKIGKSFEYKYTANKNNTSAENERKIIASLKGIKRTVALTTIDYIYDTKIWLNNKLKMFIRDFNPDIVFMFCIPDAFQYQLAKYIKNKYLAKLVLFVADDVYNQAQNTNIFLKKKQLKRLRNLLEISDLRYGASQMLCDYYSKLYKLNFSPLYKGCSIETPKGYIGTPIKISYAGNLLFGRLEILKILANVIADINHHDNKIALSIFSGSIISQNDKKAINVAGKETFVGLIPYEQVKKELHNSDIALHVESFEKNQIKKVKYSFSTKITDCLQSGSTLMVIGPKGIASVEYSREIPGAIVIDNREKIKETINEIILNKNILLKRSQSINEYAKNNHDIEEVHKKLHTDLCKLLKSKK